MVYHVKYTCVNKTNPNIDPLLLTSKIYTSLVKQEYNYLEYYQLNMIIENVRKNLILR